MSPLKYEEIKATIKMAQVNIGEIRRSVEHIFKKINLAYQESCDDSYTSEELLEKTESLYYSLNDSLIKASELNAYFDEHKELITTGK